MEQIIWTDEQEAIIGSEGDIKVNAIAGSGKTSVLVEYCRRRPDVKFLYLVFNASAKADAIIKFKNAGVSNVEVYTAHSLAYRKIVFLHGYKVKNTYNAYEIKNILGLEGIGYFGFILATHVSRLMELYFNSTYESPDELKDRYKHALSSEEAVVFYTANKDIIMSGVKELINRMDDGDMPVTHSFYLKKYQLGNPKLPYDCVLYDEMQDSSGVMIDIFMKQKCQKICVGDDNQAIYGWRGAVNALKGIHFKELPLTYSFRFNQNIADKAMRCLDLKKIVNPKFERSDIVGTNTNPSKENSATAVLARTNLLLFEEAMCVVVNDDTKKIYFEGDLKSYTFMNGISIYDVYNLHYGNKSYIRNPLIKMMKKPSDLDDYIKKTEDKNLEMLVKIVNKYGKSLPSKFKRLGEINLPKDKRHEADIVFTTIHKAKGLEYHTVKLMDDFITKASIYEKKKKKTDKINIAGIIEECNILYVAITRVKNELILPESLEFLNE